MPSYQLASRAEKAPPSHAGRKKRMEKGKWGIFLKIFSHRFFMDFS
jgi:hypothetical protein